MSGFEFIATAGGAPIKAWTRGVPVEATARQQIENVARLPFIHSHVAVMPDVHWGMGVEDHERLSRSRRLGHCAVDAPASTQGSVCGTHVCRRSGVD